MEVTVFTPTYNRIDLLKNLYLSLQKQICYNFEWIVCDDCSTDNTVEYINEIKKNSVFPITLLTSDQNGGKHRAINRGVKVASGKMFFIVDSDDKLSDDAIQQIILWEKTISKNESFAGLGFCKGYSIDDIVGNTFEGEYLDCTSLERDKYKVDGDKAEVFYTEILKKFPFPEFENENFLTEAVVWDRIAYSGYKIRWINKIIYTCEYQANGLSAKWNDNLRENINGYIIFTKQKIQYGLTSSYKKYCIFEGFFQNINSVEKKYTVEETCKMLEYPLVKYYFYKFLFFVKKKMRYVLKK